MKISGRSLRGEVGPTTWTRGGGRTTRATTRGRTARPRTKVENTRRAKPKEGASGEFIFDTILWKESLHKPKWLTKEFRHMVMQRNVWTLVLIPLSSGRAQLLADRLSMQVKVMGLKNNEKAAQTMFWNTLQTLSGRPKRGHFLWNYMNSVGKEWSSKRRTIFFETRCSFCLSFS